MVTQTPEQDVRLAALCADWLHQPFVHWSYPPEQVQALLPPGLRVDAFEGSAWISLTPLVMGDVRLFGLPGLRATRGLRTFPETNLRTYVLGPDGRQGLWFLSIDVASAAMAAVTRALSGAPYHLADLSITGEGTHWCYAGTRRGGGPTYRLRVHIGHPLVPGARDIWLTSRWRAYTRHLGGLLVTPVHHEPWPLAEATVEELTQDLTDSVGLPPPEDAPVVHYSSGVRQVRLGVSRPPLPARPDADS